MRKAVIALTVALSVASAPALAGFGFSSESGPAVVPQLRNLQKAEVETRSQVAKNDIKNIRINAIRETAETLGIQSGVKHRYAEITIRLDELSDSLSGIRFDHLLLNNGMVLPAVIEEANGVRKLISDSEMHQSMTTYRIHKPARITTIAPSWRDYLTSDTIVDSVVSDALLPKNPEEQAAWKESVTKGWDLGVKQADRMFETNLARMKRDYLGMVRFHLLAKQGIVSTPILAEGRLGLNVDGKTLDIDQRIFRITGQVNFNEERLWKTTTGILRNR